MKPIKPFKPINSPNSFKPFELLERFVLIERMILIGPSNVIPEKTKSLNLLSFFGKQNPVGEAIEHS